LLADDEDRRFKDRLDGAQTSQGRVPCRC